MTDKDEQLIAFKIWKMLLEKRHLCNKVDLRAGIDECMDAISFLYGWQDCSQTPEELEKHITDFWYEVEKEIRATEKAVWLEAGRIANDMASGLSCEAVADIFIKRANDI